jgi:hypothetical protein
MSHKKRLVTRRDFIRDTGCVALGLAVGLPAFAKEETKSAPLSKVVLVRDKNVLNAEGKLDGDVVQSMLDHAVTALFEKEDPVACWHQIIKPDDVVGIKTNEWDYLPTTHEVEQAIYRRVRDAGVKEQNIAIADRGVLNHPVFQKSTALINARPMRTHAWAGVGTLIKNYIMFVPDPYNYHENSCEPLGSIWHLPLVEGKTRLNVLVMLTPLFYGSGAHHFDPTYTWKYNGLLVGTDPVAVDTVGLRIIQLKRKEYFGEDRPVKPVAHHIVFADTKYGLGTSNPDKIKLIKIGDKDGILI